MAIKPPDIIAGIIEVPGPALRLGTPRIIHIAALTPTMGKNQNPARLLRPPPDKAIIRHRIMRHGGDADIGGRWGGCPFAPRPHNCQITQHYGAIAGASASFTAGYGPLFDNSGVATTGLPTHGAIRSHGKGTRRIQAHKTLKLRIIGSR
ncbi:MAG: hypothetical protein LW713_11285 [Acetobacteraceae bacterium]|nr:hypothetical protein [Acetobacteraceae bacterium]